MPPRMVHTLQPVAYAALALVTRIRARECARSSNTHDCNLELLLGFFESCKAYTITESVSSVVIQVQIAVPTENL
eukprot:5225665-Amphidinium_carterae.1